MQLKDLKDEFRDSRKELNARMDRLEAKQETTRKELNERIDRLENRQDKLEEKLDAKFDALASKIDSSNKHGNLMTTSVIGIALGVLYVIFFK